MYVYIYIYIYNMPSYIDVFIHPRQYLREVIHQSYTNNYTFSTYICHTYLNCSTSHINLKCLHT